MQQRQAQELHRQVVVTEGPCALEEHVHLARTLPATARGGGSPYHGRQSAFVQEQTPQIHRLTVFFTHAAGTFSAQVQFDGAKEGVLPSPFHTPDNQQYVGRIPDLEFYDPDGMMTKKKEELFSWHSGQVRRNVSFNFRLEMIDYCKSDVGTSMVKTPVELVDSTYEGIIPVDEIRRDSSPDVLFTAIADVLDPVRTGTLRGNLSFLIIEPLQGLD